ncbi:DMT family transporter [Candidatus Uhrbacteria bacterium]|nr:DMT family transporter [Candidatus Uhrbacteria bacterium]
MKSAIYVGSGAVILAALLWSLDGFLRRELYSLPASVVVFWEHLFGLVILLPFMLHHTSAWRSFSRRQWLAICGVALLSGLLGTFFYTAALGRVQYIQFSVVVLLQQLQPLFAIFAAYLLLRERISKKFLGLTVLALVSVYFVSFPDLRVHLSEGGANVVAAFLALGSAAAWGSSTAFSKYSLRGTSPLHTTATRFGFATIFALVLVGLQGHGSKLVQLSTAQWTYLLAITLSTGAVALAIYYFGLKRIPASRSTILELTWPISAVVIGYLAFGERLSATQWLGALMLVLVMLKITRDAKRAENTL